MELRQLRYLREIARLMSFGRAASALGLTQPALSKSIRALERELDVELLERNANGVVPTAYGHVLLSYATMVCTELDRAREELDALKGRGRGQVRVGGSTTVLHCLLPAILARLRERSGTDADLIVTEGLRDETVTGLASGLLDVGILISIDAEKHPEFSIRPLLRDRVAVVAAAGHPLHRRRGLSLRDLSEYSWVLPGRRELERRVLADAFVGAGLPPPVIAVQTSSSMTMAAIVEGGPFLSYLPTRMMRADSVFARLAILPIELDWPQSEISIVTRRRSVLLPATKAFVAAALAVAQALDATGEANVSETFKSAARR